MKSIYQNILDSISEKKKLLAVLIDPDKIKLNDISSFIEKVNKSKVTHVFVGGSSVIESATEKLVTEIRRFTSLPIVLFPGDVNQLTDRADGLLFLSLISGRNPDYLIGKHIESVSKLRKTHLEIIPTGYLLIENGKETSVQRITETIPMSRHNIQAISDTAKAGELLGMKLIYLEAGSGALHPVSTEIISTVKQDLNIPLIIGGGIRSKAQLDKAFKSGADIVVIGTAFEEDVSFFNELV
ncbi:geranylgeranylglyceryl/heptaprenylglyceryl phosphate synthase [Pontimicrobium aquaticum]|uniref:Geranylgeranylglyceryl phosphate synthase n=1 Tax=Pontimicrobium aquaticum TaxID=2565367 RepID=A0A4U0F0T3_9FLAO|nr:geranylgeranylglyceryl/heptaprenylglyceryl phosphate synthase [Pontimicrobium aquaticum]TJY38007.1 geranylgeranylglyceryl/heptaprenylglyceryl phosphate synthase [Pontimicrobium aquaticum]